MIMDVEYIFVDSSRSSFPSEKVMKRLMAVDREDERMENMATTPPTTSYTPKSSTPSVLRITRLVYKLISRRKSILP